MSEVDNPFALALSQLHSKILQPPASYRGRLILQFVLSAVLFFISILTVILHCFYARRHNRKIWFVRLQKSTSVSSSGRYIVFNSIPLFALLAALASIGQFGSRYNLWYINIERREAKNWVVASYIVFLPVFVQGWAFTSTNLQATLAAQRHISAVAAGLADKASRPWVQITIVVGYPAAVLALITPLAIVANAKQNDVTTRFMQLIRMLQEASDVVRAGEIPNVQPLLQASDDLARLEKSARAWLQAVLATGIAGALVLASSSLYTLYLVVILRRHVKAGQSRRSQIGKPIAFTQVSQTTVDEADTEAGRSVLQPVHVTRDSAVEVVSPFPISQPDTGSASRKQIGSIAPNELALGRLASNLSFAVPMTTLMSTVFLICSGTILAKGLDLNSWPLIEFTSDSCTYTYLSMTIVVVSFFLFNLIRAWTSDISEGSAGSNRMDSFAVVLKQQVVATDVDDKSINGDIARQDNVKDENPIES